MARSRELYSGETRVRISTRILAALMAAAVAILSIYIQVGNEWAARNQPVSAAMFKWLPLHRDNLGERLFFLAAARWDRSEIARLARQSLRSSPFNATPAVWLAEQAAGPDLEPMIGALPGLGWREAQVQRSLYNSYYEAGRYDLAVARADALLRQGIAEDELFPHLADEIEDPAFRKALASRLIAAPWQQRFLRIEGNRIPDRTLYALFKELRQAGDQRDATRQRFVLMLINRNAWDLVSTLASTGGKAGAIPAFEPAYGSDQSDPFRFTISMGYRLVSQDGGMLVANRNARGYGARTLTALAPGRYRVTLADGNPFPSAGWNWRITCANPAGPRIGRSDIDFLIPKGCPVQQFSVRSISNAIGSASRLPSLGLSKAE